MQVYDSFGLVTGKSQAKVSRGRSPISSWEQAGVGPPATLGQWMRTAQGEIRGAEGQQLGLLESVLPTSGGLRGLFLWPPY